MKVQIETTNNGFIVMYDDGLTYVFRSIDDLVLLEHLAKKFLTRNIKIAEK